MIGFGFGLQCAAFGFDLDQWLRFRDQQTGRVADDLNEWLARARAAWRQGNASELMAWLNCMNLSRFAVTNMENVAETGIKLLSQRGLDARHGQENGNRERREKVLALYKQAKASDPALTKKKFLDDVESGFKVERSTLESYLRNA